MRRGCCEQGSRWLLVYLQEAFLGLPTASHTRAWTSSRSGHCSHSEKVLLTLLPLSPPLSAGHKARKGTYTCHTARTELEGSLLRDGPGITSLSRDALYSPEQHNTVMAFCAFCDRKKSVT